MARLIEYLFNMFQTLEAEIDQDGQIHLLEPLKITGPCRILVTVIPPDEAVETTFLSEHALAVDWTREEEERAWEHIQ